MSLTLRDYQKGDLAHSIAVKKDLYMHDPGVGKTPPACIFIYYVWKHHQGKTIWSMPTHLMDKNRRELLAWSNFKPEEVAIVDGTRKQKDDIIADPKVKVFLTSFPGLVKNKAWQQYKGIKLIALDEFHKYFSNHKSPATQELYRAVKTVPYFLGMSGTLVKGRLDSAYPMLQIIAPRYYGNYTDFMAQHAITDWYGKVIGWRNHEKLKTILSRIGRRTAFEDVFGKRDIVFFIEEIDMGPKQKKAYDEFEKMGMLELEKVILEGSNEGVNLLRLRQILAHPERISVPTERNSKGGISKFEIEDASGGVDTERDERIKLHIQDHLDTKEPLVIVSTLIPEQQRLYELANKMGMKTALINSTVPNKVRWQIDKDFQAGRLQCVVGSPSTMGTGFNWSHINHILTAGLDFAADDFIQILMRGFRGKRNQPLKVTLIQYRKSVEQHIDKVLDKKSRESHLIDPTYLTLNLSGAHRTAENGVFVS